MIFVTLLVSSFQLLQLHQRQLQHSHRHRLEKITFNWSILGYAVERVFSNIYEKVYPRSRNRNLPFRAPFNVFLFCNFLKTLSLVSSNATSRRNLSNYSSDNSSQPLQLPLLLRLLLRITTAIGTITAELQLGFLLLLAKLSCSLP